MLQVPGRGGRAKIQAGRTQPRPAKHQLGHQMQGCRQARPLLAARNVRCVHLLQPRQRSGNHSGPPAHLDAAAAARAVEVEALDLAFRLALLGNRGAQSLRKCLWHLAPAQGGHECATPLGVCVEPPPSRGRSGVRCSVLTSLTSNTVPRALVCVQLEVQEGRAKRGNSNLVGARTLTFLAGGGAAPGCFLLRGV